MPRVWNKRDPSVPKEAVYVGRPTKWGNPYRIGNGYTRDNVVLHYELWLRQHPELLEEARRELQGKDLVCWCAPKRCHADILLTVANATKGG